MVKKASGKKARCTCAKCGAVKYLLAAEIDRSTYFLCDACDDKFIVWWNRKEAAGLHPSLLAFIVS